MLQRFLGQQPAILTALLVERLKNVSAKTNIVTGHLDACDTSVKEMVKVTHCWADFTTLGKVSEALCLES